MIAAAATLAVAGGCAGGGTRLEGSVVDHNGRGLPGIAVTISGPAAAEVRTDAKGAFAFRRLAAGAYRVAVRGAAGAVVPAGGARPVTLAGRGAATTIFAVIPQGLPRVADIQGRGHVSPLAGRSVSSVAGIVTCLRPRAGFYIQSPLPDGSVDTSEGLFVAVDRMPDVAPGDLVLIDGTVQERTEGMGPAGLSVTCLSLTGLRRVGKGFEVPEPVILGEGGRQPPDRVICNDADGNAEQSTYDPAEDGLDFYESLEGMIVRVNAALVVGTLVTATGELQVVGDAGRRATTLTARGGLAALAGDANPERITIDLKGEPDVATQQIVPLAVGDRFDQPIVGPLDYGPTGYRILPATPLPPAAKASLPRQTATLRGEDRVLTCAAVSVQGLGVGSGMREQAADLADTIVKGLNSPQIVALLELRDEPGTAEGAAEGVRVLLDAIRTAGGPSTYRWRDIAPAAADGGVGGDLRVGFLYDRERVQMVERMGDGTRTGVQVRDAGGRPELSFSPGLVGLDDAAFRAARRPLAAEFLFRGQRVFVIAARLASRAGTPEPFGRAQPVRPGGEERRVQQAAVLRKFVSAILTRDPDADVVLLGGFNEPTDGPALKALKAAPLFDLAEQRLPPQERYTSVHRGNCEDLDHVLVSKSLLGRADARVEIVHRYAEYPHEGRQIDRDPVVAAFRVR
jgi:uncharacterized protein